MLTSIGVPGSTATDYETWKSLDSGNTFEKQSDNFPQVFTTSEMNIGVSFNNRYYYVGDPSTIDGSSYIAQSANMGSTWEYKQSSASNARRFNTISVSRDGKYALAGNGSYNSNGDIWLTQDFGETWSSPRPADEWTRTFMDPAGENMLIGGFTTTYYSSNYGSSWTAFSQGLTALGGAMISGDGNYKVVFEQYEQSSQKARVYVSTDWSNWTQNNLTVRLIGGSISNDGKYILIGSSDGYNSPEEFVNLSTDYGQTWSQINLTGLYNYTRWSDTAMSWDGKYMIVIPGFNQVGYAYKSTDYGQNWQKENAIPQGAYNTVKMSKSGRYVYVTGTSKGILVSNDYMASWDHQFDTSTGGGVFINF